MPEESLERPTLLVLTSTFPRWNNDTEPAFVLELCKRVGDRFRVIVLAPHAPGARRKETMDGLSVHRYRYFFEKWQSLAYDGGILNKLKANPLRYFLVPFFLLSQLRALIVILRRERVDIIHAHWIIPQGLVVALAKQFHLVRAPVVCTSHGADLFAMNGPLLSRLKTWILSSCGVITVVSNIMKKKVLQLGVDEDRIRVISMGVDLATRFTPADDGQRSGNEILFVGRLVEKKGVLDLLHAVRKIADQHDGVTLLVIGGGPQKEMLEQAARSLGISDRVNFMGPLHSEELVRYYRRAAVAAFPFTVARGGDQEGLGLVLIEALGCECPVVASDLEAVKDVIIPERNGLLTRPGDRNGIAAAILHLLQEPVLAADMASRGRQYVLSRFNWDIVAARYADLMDEMIR